MNYTLKCYFENNIYEYFLPGINNRKIKVDIESNISGCRDDFDINLEVWNDTWFIVSSEQLKIKNKQVNKYLDKVSLEKNLVINLELTNTNEKVVIIVYENYSGYTSFDKYINNFQEITIGSGASNDLQYNSQNLVTKQHLIIKNNRDGSCIAYDKSSNGTFVNGKKITDRIRLNFGDIVNIMGLKLIYLNNIIAINNPRGLIKSKKIVPYVKSEKLIKENKYIEEYYRRSPRHIEYVDNEIIEIEAPPNPNTNRKQPLAFIIGPAFTMVIPMTAGIMFTMWSASRNENSTMSPFMFMGLVTSFTSAIVGVFWALANYKYSNKQEKIQEKRRNDLYRKYLEKKRSVLAQKHIENRELLLNKYPKSKKSFDIVEFGKRRLWERNINHIDFLKVRIGEGNIVSPNEISISKDKFTMIDDVLAEEPKRIKEEYFELKGVPICIPLKKYSLVGVIGDSEHDCINVAKILSTQISTYHSYTDVKMAYIFDKKHANDFYFAKWLPHSWDKEKNIRMTVSDENGVKELFYHLNEIIRVRLEADENKRDEIKLPHYVVFVSSIELIENHSILKFLYDTKLNIGFTVVLLYKEIGLLPNDCTVIIQNSGEFKGLYSLDNSFNENKNIKFDEILNNELITFSKRLANIRVLENETAGAIPKMLTFLDMYKTSTLKDIDIERRWLENRTFESMKAIIGYKGENLPLYLDIHEKYHGPHGLVAGTTGSGKSETLQTYILSLALNYHPYEISFILIDYKGGGMAGSFEKLPHTAGIITNLGGNQTNRALASINSEIKRRQSMLNAHKLKHIDGYIELFRENKVTKPMPHLIIIADEFAELKKEQPEFVRELVSASRVGRSLGVHLILATQKPSGVVDEEIWSNSKFKLCLRVQDKQDSNEMIKRPDAAYITNPGAGYFQVGNDEIFSFFQSGWSGAKYEPEIKFTNSKENEVNMLNLWGKSIVVTTKKKDDDGVKSEQKKTQLESVVFAINEFALEKNILAINDIWLPPLPSKLSLRELKDNYIEEKRTSSNGIAIPIGIVDDPKRQKQYAFNFDLCEVGNTLVIGSTGSGKTTFLQTFMYSLVSNFTPKEINIYIGDFGSRILGSFKNLPHVGEVLFNDDYEKMDKLIKLFFNELKHRKSIFAEKGIASIKEYVEIYNDVPYMLFVVDNYSAFIELNPKLEDKLISLAMECASYGIYIVIANNSLSDIRYKLRQSFNNGIGLQLNDKYEYEEVLGTKIDMLAESRTVGRGLVCYPEPLELQIAKCFDTVDALAFNKKLKEEFKNIIENWSGEVATKVPQVPIDMTFDNIMAIEKFNTLVYETNYIPYAFNVDDASIETVDLEKIYCYLISGEQKTGKTNLLKVFIKMAKLKKGKVYIFDNDNKELESYSNLINSDGYFTTLEDTYNFFKDVIIPEFTRRNANKAKYIESNEKNITEYIASDEKIFIFINDITAFCEMIYSAEKSMNTFVEQMIEKGDKHMIYLFANISTLDMVGDYNTKKTIRRFISYKEGIHLGGKIDDQKVLDLELSISERNKKLPKGYGHISDDGITKKLKVLKL